MSIGLAIIRSAGLLVPATERPEWFAEWRAELCFIEQTRDSRALTFSLGAFKDAFWFRQQCRFRWLDSPVQCLSFLALIAIISLIAARPGLSWSLFRDAHGVVVGKTDHPPAGAAFYRRIEEPVHTWRGMSLFAIVHASGNLFEVLHTPAPRPDKKPILILSRSLWWNYFGGDRHIAGRTFEVDGRRVQIGGMIPDDAWPFPGYVDAFLLEDPLPSAPGSFVIARSGNIPGLRPPPRRVRDSMAMLVLALLAALLIAPATTLLIGIRQWPFLLAKIALILPTTYACASLAGICDMPLMVVLCFLAVCPGSGLALGWALADQHRRCPVCLRLLSNPVRFGNSSHTFLNWYGTELMCDQGHGVLRVPEIVASGVNARQWVELDELCLK
ncbi:MAG TPA: hypothetical protein VK789_26555 [Bryobacteraceae bacterium]|nr:hypothetical protein [Bryobacteraceae bacterium]